MKNLSGVLFIVLLIYLPSLFRPWLPFDEGLFYEETNFPIPVTFIEIPEVIKYFILNYHIESMNTFFSNVLNVRSNSATFILVTVISCFFQKNYFLYHLLQVGLHLLNTFLVWCIFSKFAHLFIGDNNKKLFNILVSLFVILWSIHSANTEAVLLTTNWTAILTYTFCFSFILYEINLFSKPDNQLIKPIRVLIVSTLFTLLMFLTEHAFTLPFILLFLIYAFRKSMLVSLKQALPYFMGLVLYLVFSFFTSHLPSLGSAFVERNLWLTPQIFIHLLKLIIFPKTLSIYQSNLTTLGDSLVEPYTVFCTIFYFLFLLLPIALFFLMRKKIFLYIFILIYPFYFSLLPFLHVVTPAYCLSADRYCYFPSFFFCLILFNLTIFFSNKISMKKTVLVLFICVFAMSTRTIVRIFEWKNPYKLYESAVEAEKEPLYKAQKKLILANYLGTSGKNHLLANKILKESLHESYIALSQLKVGVFKEPLTLREYGLDKESLLLKAAYLNSKIRYQYFNEPLGNALSFYESYLNNKLDYLDVGQFIFYGDLLLKSGQIDKAKNVLEYGIKKYPLSSALIFSLVNVYLNYYGDINKTYYFLELAYKYYPNASFTLHGLYNYYGYKNDLNRQAEFAYLIGLRDHSIEYYEKACDIYRGLNNSVMIKKIENKIAQLKAKI